MLEGLHAEGAVGVLTLWSEKALGGNRSASEWGGELAGGDLLAEAGGDCDIGRGRGAMLREQEVSRRGLVRRKCGCCSSVSQLKCWW